MNKITTDDDESLGNEHVSLPTVIDERPRGAIDVAVHRNEVRIFQKLKAISAAAGDDFFYRFPTKNKDGTTKWIEGPSIKCANAVARVYGNNATRIRSQDNATHWLFTAQFYDFETGYVLERQFQQRKSQKTIKTDTDRQMDIIFQIGQSKAIRNVVVNALSEFADYAFMEAQQGIVEKVGRDLKGYLERVKGRLKELGVDIKRVELTAGRSAENWLAPDIARTIAEIQSCNDGMASPDDVWPPLDDGTSKERPKREDFVQGKDGEANTARDDALHKTPPAETVPEVAAGGSKPKRGRPPKAAPVVASGALGSEGSAPNPEQEGSIPSAAANAKPKIETAMERGLRLIPLTRTVADVTDLQASISDEIAPSEVTAWALACSKRAKELG
jgi:hypothetical protein